MLDNQIQTLTRILRDEDIQNYAGEGFWNLIQAVVMSDPFAGISSIKNIRDLIFHLPTVLFWDKMKRYLLGTFHDYESQVKMAQKFNNDNTQYAAFVKRQIHTIQSIDDDLKIDFYAALTRCFLLTDMDQTLFFKLSKFITSCTVEELQFLQGLPYDYFADNSAMISMLYQSGLFMHDEKPDGSEETCYVLSDFAKALKENCLNFDDERYVSDRLTHYHQLAPLNIAEFASKADMDEIFKIFDD